MNYIKRLQKNQDTTLVSLDEIQGAINELRCYLRSSKFDEDTTVQVKDIIHRLDPIEDRLVEAQWNLNNRRLE